MPNVAIVGASRDRSKYGNKAVRAYLRKGYNVYPINPSAGQVEGLPAFATVRDVPVAEFDLVTYYLPPALTIKALDDLAKVSAREVLFNPGSCDEAVLERARQLQLNFSEGCSIIAAGFAPSQL